MEVKEPSARYLVPRGFKRTDVGLIPQDWDVLPLEEFTSFISYGFTNPMPTSESGVYMITAKDINHGRIQFDTARCTTDNAYRTLLTAKSRPKSGDLLLTKDGTLGRLALVGSQTVCINQSVALLRPNFKIVPELLKLLLEAPVYQSRMLDDAGGSTIKHIYITIVNRMPVAAPPTKAEQEAIAEALGDADALIESLEQLISKKRNLKQGAMQGLLTGKRRLPGFSVEWEPKRIGDVLTVAHGRSQNGIEDRSGKYPILATGGQIGTTNQFLHDRPSVLIGRKGTIDKPQFMEIPFWTVDTLFYSVVHEPNIAKFLYYRFCLIDWKQFNEASGVPSLNAKTIERIEIMVPKRAEQTAIATILTDMDAEITTLETKLTKARHIKQGMMQELLTGRIRLV